MARRYWLKISGERYLLPAGCTRPAAEREGQAAANRLGQRVTVGFDEIRQKTIRAKRNPDPGAFLEIWREKIREHDRRVSRSETLKPKRLAKSSYGRRAKSAAPPKGGPRYLVTAKRGRLVEYELTRPSKREADALAAQLEAVGYKATVRAL